MRSTAPESLSEGEPIAMSDVPRVLLVDDQDDARALMRQFLKREHVIVEEAVDGSDALERVRAAHFDLVLMDVHMPGIDGLSATRSIRAHESETGRARTVILALTADDTQADRQASIAAGCDEHVTKPIRRKRLGELLDRWLGPRERRSD